MALAALLVLGVAGTLPLWLRNTSGPVALAAIAPDSIGVVDPGRNELVDQIALHARPAAVAYGAGSLWVATHDAQTLVRIDPRTRMITATKGLGSEPTAVAVGDGFVWVLCGPDRLLFQFDADTGSLVRRHAVNGRLPPNRGKGLALPPLGVAQTEPFGLAAGGGAAWVAYADSVGRVDAETGARQPIWIRTAAVWFARRGTTSGAIWIVGPREIVEVDSHTGRVAQRIPRPNVGSEHVPGGIASVGEIVWAMQHTTAWMIDARLGRVVAVIPLGHEPVDLDVDGQTVWTANDDGTVSRIDAKTGTSVKTIPLGKDPRNADPVQLAAGHGAVWVGVQQRHFT